MTIRISQNASSARKGSKGFALVVTLTLMVLLSILALGMLSLSTVSLRSMSVTSADEIARANARLGLLTALGKLQTQLGPDQRISARAVSFAADPVYGVTVSDNTPGAWWVGVAHGKPGELLPDGKQVDWLVSGVTGNALGNSALTNAVPIFSSNSLDLDKYTSGDDIQAGRVAIKGSELVTTGSYAWFVDDEGMKAQLSPSNSKALNSNNAGRGLLAAGADLGELGAPPTPGEPGEMEDLTGTDPVLLAKLNSIRDLPFLGSPATIASKKHFDYTTRSYGVLSDALRGGLRKDLTIAFENEAVFNKVFPKSDQEKYLLINPEKLAGASDLKKNGYIHWDIFNDYYNMKKYIQNSAGVDFLDYIGIRKQGFYTDSQSGSFYRGEQGPHQMNPSGKHSGHPYGEYPVMREDQGLTGEYRHSPVSPVLSFLQMNAWLTEESGEFGDPKATKHYLRTRTQLWTGHYNPYNIAMRVKAANSAGPRIMNFPQTVFKIPKYGEEKLIIGFDNKRQTSQAGGLVLQPGRSHVLGLLQNATGGSENDSGPYSEKVQTITNQNVYYDTPKKDTKPTGDIAVRIDFVMNRSSLMHGCNEQTAQPENDCEVSQVMFTPFAWDETQWTDNKMYPGKRFEYSKPHSELGTNSAVSIMMELRTAKESGDAIRPLVDSNIRAQWVNPKWDFELNLPAPAAYSASSSGEAFSKNIEMNHPDSPAGYSYLGASHAASDGFDRVILYDVPREDLLSLGQLQHANAGRFSYEPSYIVGNSHANIRIPKGDWKTSASDTYSGSRPAASQWAISGKFDLYDASYLVNEVLWDSYVFTTLPQQADNHTGDDALEDYENLLNGNLLLPNPRFIPYEPKGSKFDEETLKKEGTATEGSFFHNAGHLLVDGSFNIHSTSVDAWEAFLNGAKGLPVGKVDGMGTVTGYDTGVTKVRFPRVKSNFGEGAEAGDASSDFWAGFRELEKTEVRELAAAIVAEIKSRGVFHGLGEFVNRRLESGDNGNSGALQAALDKSVNLTVSGATAAAASHSKVPADQKQSSGFPGHLQQGDILQALSPYMSARSDTFTIRAYGEAVNPAGEVTARAWCEATVQRLPDAVVSGAAGTTVLSELVKPTSGFGRRFVVQSFRWLNKDEV